ncbi:amidophosphoribosyltransferase [Candidatus Gottesmanbacteria bacterium RIFCSPHIGHO2_01_FULL_39_10]|uniref:Amidophosphoribosyltransferase n=1 Tax=Candidatus Gottesmanbacteria bacterium RIFCSPHIGHO2_01_FULL_39_10 TaxID=1798375 RepID=A0A1F5ZL26_9BACT|nr:MAG: amidophosphoribosyltransferase [Candidatus Gottesmanbacteria bacterium RIFCSPHIGHO2_01_FULL_39_10]
MIDFKKLKYQESFKDHCGVFGIYGRGENVAKITYFALHSLQHRGQEGAGIVSSDGKTMRSIRKLGLVTSAFNEENLKTLPGFVAIGHNRYSTTGGNTANNVQPVIIPGNGQSFAVSHNGNIVNADKLSDQLKDIKRVSTSDTEILALTITKNKESSWGEKILSSLPLFDGAYSIVACTKEKLYAFRDPWGIRPLIIGKLGKSYVVSSESCAFDTIGADYIRDVELGEVIEIDDNGIKSIGTIPKKERKFCLFEYVYLARPDSVLNNRLVHAARQKTGEMLALEAPVKADLVVAVPDSGTSAALGYSKASGIPFGEALIKNRYIGRTFISPEQHLREQGVRMKFNPMKRIVSGKRIVIVDDSIVRGTTMRQLVDILRKSGAKKIHLRICSPPIKWPCFFGVDTPNRKMLIAAEMTIAQIKKFIAADSLKYLSLSSLIKATEQDPNSVCTACFSGKYPMKVNMSFKKNVFEANC